MGQTTFRNFTVSFYMLNVLCYLLPVLAAPGTFSFASYYGDNMVLQRAPQRANVWGFSDTTEGAVELTISNVGTFIGEIQKWTTGGIWSVQLPPVSDPGPYSITVKREVTPELALSNILFGDVWLCSGQSNMQFTLGMSLNASQELAEAHLYPNIRVFTAAEHYSAEPLADLYSVEEQWAQASKESLGGKDWSYFSAVCWLYGKNIYQKLKRPIGLVATTWGGTRVEAWSSPAALKDCGLQTQFEDGPNDYSVLWNAMIYPFLKMTIYGAIWYQGEANANNPNTYNCSFPAMIDDWRRNFNDKSGGQTSANFPFGFVQLAPYRNDPKLTTGWTDIRWHQTADFGFAPNPRMPNTFMAVAMDLPDFSSPYGSVHPRDKPTVGERLALSGLSVAYGLDLGPYQGPLPSAYYIDIGFDTLKIEFDNSSTTLDVRNSDGYELCCSKNNQSSCDGGDSFWSTTPITDHDDHSITLSYKQNCSNYYVMGIRYAWRESPCPYKQCAVYEKGNGIPSPPYRIIGLIGGDKKISKNKLNKFPVRINDYEGSVRMQRKYPKHVLEWSLNP